MCLPLTTGTTLTVGSVFITGTVVDSRSSSSVILGAISASISISSFPSRIDVTHVFLEEPGLPFSKAMQFCKTTELITAVPSQDTNEGPIRIMFSKKMITQSYWFTSLQLPKNPPPNVLVIVAPLGTYLPVSCKTWRDITMFTGAIHTFLSEDKQTQSTSPTVFI